MLRAPKPQQMSFFRDRRLATHHWYVVILTVLQKNCQKGQLRLSKYAPYSFYMAIYGVVPF